MGVGMLYEQQDRPLIVSIPLSKDGCIDTEVDIEKALEVLAAGCISFLSQTWDGKWKRAAN